MYRLLYFVVALVLAWFLGPFLSRIVGGISISEETSRKLTEYLKSRDALFYLQLVIWTIVLTFLLPRLLSLFGALIPQASRYSTSKPMRRVHNVVAMVVLTGVYFLAIAAIVMWFKPVRLKIFEFVAAQQPVRPGETRTDEEVKRLAIGYEAYRVEGLRLDLRFWMYSMTIQFYWKKILPMAVFCFFISHWLFKRRIARVHRVIMRVIDEGRFGQGGSGRFAGLIEEWGVMSSHSSGLHFMQRIIASISRNEKLADDMVGGFILFKREGKPVGKPELFMGRSLYTPFLNIGLADDRHMLTIAGSRSGKGATAIIPNLLLWEGSAVVIDPKGTNAAVTANYRRRMGQKVHLVDPFGIVEKDETKRASFNPLEVLDPASATIREDINVIADALVVPDPEAKEKHWDDGARTILAGFIGQLVSDPKFKPPCLPMLRDLLALQPEKQNELWAEMFLNEGAGKAPMDAASRVIRGIGSEEISGLISNADKHTEWLSSSAIDKTLRHSTFSFSEIKERPTTIYLILPPAYLATHNRFLRLFINMALLQMSQGGRSKVPVLMMLDEFPALGRMNEVEKAFGLMAGYNLILWAFVQDMAQLKELYKNSVNTFVTNSRAVQVFGVSDEVTTDFITKQLGNRSPINLTSLFQPGMRMPCSSLAQYS